MSEQRATERAVADVCKAQPCGSHPLPDLCITASREFPRLPDTATKALSAHAAQFVADATAVVEALHASLPGGTLDQILRLMLERKASQFVVRFDREE